ncbi:MAG: zinc ribbon domain-containing protein [Eubacterium sp.]|nr:zinc ribbon domain-containing protein [Eubacterium sp.]
MDFFDKMVSTISSTGKDLGEKAKETADLAKLQLEIRSKKDFIDRQYAEIGKKVYEEKKDMVNSGYEEIFLIKHTYEEIEEIKKEIADLKGYQQCPSCGANVKADDNFCPKCGSPFTSQDDEMDIIDL